MENKTANKNTFELTSRASQVLADVVDLYAASGTPVGSKALVESGKQQLSPASIRNVMRDLEAEGLLTHPHTSAGRVPTEEGYRFYAKNVVIGDEVDDEIKTMLQAKAGSGKEVSGIIKDVSNTLSELTGCASLITAPKHVEAQVETIEFVRLGDGKVLAVVVTAFGEIENRIIEVPPFITLDELNKASHDLKKAIAGQTLGDARDALIANLAEQKGRVNEMIDQMMQAANDWGQPVVSDGAMVVAGSTHLFQYPELVRDKLQGLIKMFEEKRLLMALMEEVQQGEGVQVFIGRDSKLEAAADCSIIAGAYGNDSKKVLGTLGVIGPMRMDYKKTMGIVNYTGRLLSKVINERGL